MIISNNILVRVSGLEFDVLEKFIANEAFKQVKLNAELVQKRNFLVENIIVVLFNLVKIETEYKLKLIQLKRVLFNRRNYSKYLNDITLPEVIMYHLNQLHKLDLELAEKIVEYESIYNNEYHSSRTHLKSLTELPVFRNGLLLSSSSLLDSSDKYLSESLNSKRSGKTELGLTLYLSRIAAKTSPFSSFTNLCLAKIDNKVNVVGFRIKRQVASKVEFNNYLLQTIIGIAKNSPLLYCSIPLRFNNTIEDKGNCFEFLTNSNNSEAFQKVEKNELINLLVALFKERDSMSINGILDILKKNFEIEEDALQGSILQLISIGLLEFKFGLSGSTNNWIKDFLMLLKNHPITSKFCEEISPNFSSVEKLKMRYQNSSHFDRPKILQLLYNSVVVLINNLKTGLATPLSLQEWYKTNSETEQSDDRIFVHHDPVISNFKKEKIIYEDTAVQSDIKINEKKLRELIFKINFFLENSPQHPSHLRVQNDLVKIYKDFFSSHKSVPILEFYKTYKQNKNALENQSIEKINNDIFQNRVLAILNAFPDKSVDVLNFSISEIFPNAKIQMQESYGMLTQFYDDNGVLCCIPSGIFEGNNKLFGRFIEMFNKEDQIDILSYSKYSQQDELFIENCDSSYFNANIHPQLLNYEIDMPGSQSTYPLQSRIPIKKLAVRINSETQNVELFYCSTGRKIHILDLGFQAEMGRSSMFSFLNKFNKQKSNWPFVHFSSIVNTTVRRRFGDSFFLPRIMLDEQIIIQRKVWYIAKSDLPNLKDLNQSELFEKINNWRSFITIPDEVFINFKMNRNSEGDYHKPQYINFKSPLLVNLFNKGIQKIEEFITISEMLPSKEQLFESDNKRFVSEYLVQWK